MNKAVCILGIVVMVAKGTLTPSVSVRCRNPQPDFKETVSVNGTTICHCGETGETGECCFSASFNDPANGKKKWF